MRLQEQKEELHRRVSTMKFIYIVIMEHALFGLNNMFIEQQQADLDQPIHTPSSALAIQSISWNYRSHTSYRGIMQLWHIMILCDRAGLYWYGISPLTEYFPQYKGLELGKGECHYTKWHRVTRYTKHYLTMYNYGVWLSCQNTLQPHLYIKHPLVALKQENGTLI